MALTDTEKLAICTEVLRGEPVTRGDVIMSMRNGEFIVHDTSRADPVIHTRSWDEAFYCFETYVTTNERQSKLREYTVRIIMSELTIIAKSAERAEEIAMEIYEGDARTHLTHGLAVECCEVEDQGPSDEDEETEA